VRAKDLGRVLARHTDDMLMFDVPPPVAVRGSPPIARHRPRASFLPGELTAFRTDAYTPFEPGLCAAGAGAARSHRGEAMLLKDRAGAMAGTAANLTCGMSVD
jgi:hypothetical protein